MIAALVLLSLSISNAGALDGFKVLLPAGQMTPHERYRKASEPHPMSPCVSLLRTASPLALGTLLRMTEVTPILKRARSDRASREVLADLLMERGSSYGEFLKLLADAQATDDRTRAQELNLRATGLLLRDHAVWFSDWDSPEIVTVRFDASGLPLGLKFAGPENFFSLQTLQGVHELYEAWGMTQLAIHLENRRGSSSLTDTAKFFSEIAKMMNSTPIHHLELTNDPGGQQFIESFRSTVKLFGAIAASDFARKNLRSLIWQVRDRIEWREQELTELGQVPEFFERFDHLESLELGQAAVETDLIAALARAKAPLRHLGLSNGHWADGPGSLQDFPKLNSLSLDYMQLDDSRYAQILEIAPRLIALDLRLHGDRESFRQALLVQGRALEQVRWGQGPDGTYQAEINSLAALPHLRELDLFEWELGNPGMRDLKFDSFSEHGALEKLKLDGAVSKAQLSPFLKIPTLRRLDLPLFEEGIQFPTQIQYIHNRAANLKLQAPGLITLQLDTWRRVQESENVRAAYPGVLVGSGVTVPFELPMSLGER